MREDWESFKLKEVCEIRPPKRETKEILSEDDLVSFVPMSHLNEERKDFHEEVAKPLKRVYKGYTYFKDNDVLLAKITPCFENGKMGIAKGLTNGVGFGSSEYIVYRPDSRLISEYLFYFLLLPKFRAEGEKMMGGAVGHQRIPKEFYEDYEIPIPPLPEQKSIVAILDRAFEAIDQARANIDQNIENAEELFQSKLNDIFSQRGEGWEINKLGKACEISMGQSPKGSTYNDEGIGTPLINGPVEFGPKPFSETVMSKWTTDPKKMCKKGDLILCVRGSTTGRINIAGFDACIGRGVASIRYDKNQKWLNYFIRANQEYIYSLGSGSTFPNVSGKILKKIKFPQPPIEVQNKLIEVMEGMVNNTNQILSAYRTKLQNIEELKKSILQKAFSGELTANEYVAV